MVKGKLNARGLKRACERLAASDERLAAVLREFGVPPLWDRPQGFATLIRIILEQQVSLASARACFDKLAAATGELSPKSLLALEDSRMRAIGFSRQKASYARHLADAMLARRFDFARLPHLPDEEAKTELMKLKGVGHWTADIYMLMAMLRPDVMPRGDIALHTAWQRLSNRDRRPTSDEFLEAAEDWRPYRSVAARLLWHYYLSKRAE